MGNIVTGFVSLIGVSLAFMVLTLSQLGQFLSFHQHLHQRAERIAIVQAALLHRGSMTCTGLPVDISSCQVRGEQVQIVISGQIRLFGRDWDVKNGATVMSQWVGFTG
ncbi:MAG: hypothetical protein RIS09_1006 [Actinomycetota bacterium]|jgi:hypothetical protein